MLCEGADYIPRLVSDKQPLLFPEAEIGLAFNTSDVHSQEFWKNLLWMKVEKLP